MSMSEKELTRAEAQTRISRLKKMVKNHEEQCACVKCVELANAEIAYTFDYEDYGSYL